MIDPSLPPRTWYTKEQVEGVLQAYRTLFPVLTPGLRRYWNFERAPRHELLPYLTTDFHEASYRDLSRLSEAALAIEQGEPDLRRRAERLIAATRPGIGFSIGISPWTDHSLFQTWAPGKKKLVVIVGHDWYPITCKDGEWDHRCDMPTWRYGGLHDLPRYEYALPKAVLSGQPVVLFLNLVPDYRPPEAPKTGRLRGYADWLAGFDEVLASLQKRYADISVITWGAHAWQALWPNLDAGARVGLKRLASTQTGKLHVYGRSPEPVRLLPTAHPCFRPNFHVGHAQAGYKAMGLA